MKRRYAMLLLVGCVLVQTGLCQTESRTLEYDGRTRTYRIHVPLSYDPICRVPLVLSLHGYGNTSTTNEEYSGWSRISDREGFIVVYPDAIPDTAAGRQMWNAGSAYEGGWDGPVDDVNFLSTLIDTISDEYNIDSNRIFVFGYSNGAFMAYYLGISLPDKFAAIAPDAGLVSAVDFLPGPPVSVIHFHGDNDPDVPYEGYPNYGYPGVEDGIALWVLRNGCNPETEILKNNSVTLARKWSAPEGKGDVVLYKLKGHDHSLPNSARFNSMEVAWAFFMEHPKVDISPCLDPNGPVQNLTTEERYSTIKGAVEYAHNGDEIVLAPGTYRENIDLTRRNIVLRSEDPKDPNNTTSTILQGDGQHPVVKFYNNNATCALRGLTIIGGQVGLDIQGASPQIEYCRLIENVRHGIDMQAKSDPIISNTLICANGRTGVHMTGFVDFDFTLYNEPNFINCTIADNTEEGIVGGIVTMNNCIVYGNGTAQLSPVSATVSYSCIQGGYTGDGNIETDPAFAQLAYWDPNDTPDDPNDDVWVAGDYHLKSQAGRFDPNSAAWVLDDVTSPCIDAGDPGSDVVNEPDPNGGVINMGAYGGTMQASKSGQGD